MPAILTFPLHGPSRRADVPVIEVRLDTRDPEFPRGCPDEEEVHRRLARHELLASLPPTQLGAATGPDALRFANYLGRVALGLQQAGGHAVNRLTVRRSRFADWRILVLVEQAHAEVGLAAVRLAVLLLGPAHGRFAREYRSFLAFARERALPADSLAIARAAERRDVPVLYLARPPLAGAVRLPGHQRGAGLLQLGQGVRRRQLDGTFDLSRADEALRALRRDPQPLHSQARAAMAGSSPPAEGPRRRFRLLGIGDGLVVALRRQDSAWAPVAGAHPAWEALVTDLLRRTGGQPILLELETADLDAPPHGEPGAVRDVQVGPDLSFLAGVNGGAVLDDVAGALLEWLFPGGAAARIPLVSITGTNGKTTTTRMVAHIVRRAGLKTGVVTSEGVNLDGRQVTNQEAGSFLGHARVLTDPSIEAAVLETHHRGIAVHGFAFRDCDVGVCLNVSPDHIARGEIETMEEMADVKTAVPERASGAAVLFADDPWCRAMGPRLRARTTWWVSLAASAQRLGALPASGERAFCTLEPAGAAQGADAPPGASAEWIVVHAGGERRPLLPVADIPATFGGAARFMVSNAMHAAAAALALGIQPTVVVEALACFEAGPDMTPGRLNEIDGLPFRLILDFAHNPDGMARLAEFTDRLEVSGRRRIALSGMGKREDAINRLSARALAGHFHHYYCKEYTPSEPPLTRPVAPLMQAALIEAGVEPERTTLLHYGKSVLFEILSDCAPGDLLVYLIGNAEKAVILGYIDEYRRGLE